MLVYPKEDSVIIADTVADEGIAACRPGSQYVRLDSLKSFLSRFASGREDKNPCSCKK